MQLVWISSGISSLNGKAKSSDSWDVMGGIPQGSIVGLLFFNIFINNVFFYASQSDVCNFDNNSTISSCGKILGYLLHNLKLGLGYIL